MPGATRKAAAARAPRTRTRLDVEERRAQLLALAIGIFGERSYDEVSIDDLARAAGVSKGLLYHYYPTKRDLYVAVIVQASQQLLDETLTRPEDAPEQRLRLGIDAYLDFVERHGPAYVALMRGGIGSDPEVAAILERTRSAFLERVALGMPEGFVTPLLRTALRGWIGFVEATAIEWFSRRDITKMQLSNLLAGVLLRAIEMATGVTLYLSP